MSTFIDDWLNVTNHKRVNITEIQKVRLIWLKKWKTN